MAMIFFTELKPNLIITDQGAKAALNRKNSDEHNTVPDVKLYYAEPQ